MDKLDELSTNRKRAHATLCQLKSKVYASFLQMEQEAYADGALPKKIKELIAVGISVHTACESCMQWHIDQAAACGATQHEVLEAVEVGVEMGAGRVTVSARFALDVMARAYASQRELQPERDAAHSRA
jgi:AhpD family alkylhydroperoxidase